MKTRFLFLCLLFLSHCSGNGLFKDVQGIMKSSSPTTLTIPSSPQPPAISILGRSDEEFEVEFVAETLDQPQSSFIIHDAPTKEPVIFEITHPSFDPVLSFPIDLNAVSSITLPALPAGTVSLIIDGSGAIDGINDLGMGTVDPAAGMILGQISSSGSVDGGCSTFNSIQIKDKATETPSAVLGPFYFDTTSSVVNSGHFSDSQCSYVIANVLAGNYILEFLDFSLQVVATYEVVVLSGNVIFGMDLP